MKKEGANDTSSYAVSPVKALSSAVLPVKTYFTEKEIIRKKSEKKKRGEQKMNRRCTCPSPIPCCFHRKH